MMNLVVIFFSFVLVNNFILSKFMGLCPFIGVSRNRESAVGMGFAVIFVMSITSVLTWVIYHGILAPLGIYLPLITTNCAVLGIAIIAVDENYGALESLVAGMSGGIGFLMVLIIMSFLREKLSLEKVPEPFKGVPVAFVTAGAMALAFMAFSSSMIANLFPAE